MTGNPAGMGKKSQAAYSASQYVPFEMVKLGEAGRLVIPAALRQQMGIRPGDELLLRVARMARPSGRPRSLLTWAAGRTDRCKMNRE